MSDLLGNFPDLMEEFTDFLERSENIGKLNALISSGCFYIIFNHSFRSHVYIVFLTFSAFADGFLAGVISKSTLTHP